MKSYDLSAVDLNLSASNQDQIRILLKREEEGKSSISEGLEEEDDEE